MRKGMLTTARKYFEQLVESLAENVSLSCKGSAVYVDLTKTIASFSFIPYENSGLQKQICALFCMAPLSFLS